MVPDRFRNILIAEDNSLISFNLEDVLRELGCESVETREVAGGLRLLEEMDFDFAIIDVVLADGTSEPLMNALRQRGVPYAISSGMSKTELGIYYPDVPLLLKPYGTGEVADVIDALATARRAPIDHAHPASP